MRAARIHEFGPPNVITIDEIEKPRPGNGEVLVELPRPGSALGTHGSEKRKA